MLIKLSSRTLLRISGEDRQNFLQGLITQDVRNLKLGVLSYGAMLTAQGKLIADFFILKKDAEIWLECHQDKAALLIQKLAMFKLRSKVSFRHEDGVNIFYSSIEMENALADPRHPAMGFRLYSDTAEGVDGNVAYDSHRLELGIPETEDIIEDRSFPMELGIHLLHGISYTKGCYTGQEVVARSKTRGVLHKAIHKVRSVQGETLSESGTTVMLGDAEIGTLRTVSGSQGLAILRIEEATKPDLQAGGISIIAELPDWFSLPTPVMQSL